MKKGKRKSIDYSKYKLSVYEMVIYTLIWIVVSAVFSFFFYRSKWAFIPIFAFLPLFLRYVKKRLIRNRDWKLTLEFKELLRIVSTDVASGSSVENAFIWASGEMKRIYPRKCLMKNECEIIVNGLSNNIVIEELIASLALRSKNEEINDFSHIFSVAKRSGCNLREIIDDINEAIDVKTETKREFRVLTASKQLEHRIMCVVPFVIMGYMMITTPGYFDTLYHSPKGVGIMTCCMIVYMGAFTWGERIANITV